MEDELYTKIVFICSPYRPENKDPELRKREIETNLETARKACAQAIKEGYIPLAPHLYFTQFVDDGNEEERKLGKEFGLRWLRKCDELWVFSEPNISEGMKEELRLAEELGIPVMPRTTKEF